MFSRVKTSHIRTAVKDTREELAAFFTYFWFFLLGLFNWSKGFGVINKTYAFLIPKIIIVIIGSLFTGIPFYLLLPLAFLPGRVIAPVFFVAFIVMFTH